MRLYAILFFACIIGLSGCVLEHNPVSPAMTFKTGTAYTPANDTLDTLSAILIGFSATRGNSNMSYLQVAKGIDTAAPVLLNTYILTDSQSTSVSKDFAFTSGAYRANTTETYTFKISDAAGFTFQKSISFTIHPH